VGRLLGPALRAGLRPGRDAGRPLRRTLTDLVEEQIALAGRELTLLRPPSADELIDEKAFADDEFLPYWAELWPSGVALARAVAGLELRGVRVVELGAGLGLPSLAAALRGADVLATDWADEAVELLRTNAQANRIVLRAERVRWDAPEPLLREAPWPLVLGADLLYERRNAEQLLELLPQLGGDVLLAEPGRPFAGGFFERARKRWDVETVEDRLFRLRLR
jgi:predicted nicotinamide N-methyase